MEKLYTVSKNKTRSGLWLRSWAPYCQIRLKLKKVGKTTRPFRYDLNQFPYDYTVEVRNRFKGLDLIDRVPDELWTEVRDMVQETGIKTIPMEKKCKKAKWLSEEALQMQYVNRELPVVQAGFRKGRGTRDQIANIRWITEKAKEFQKNIFLLYWLCQSLRLCGSQ